MRAARAMMGVMKCGSNGSNGGGDKIEVVGLSTLAKCRCESHGQLF